MVACMLLTLVRGPVTLVPTAYSASSFRPTIFVNTEAFLAIDDDDTTADVVLRFGDTLAKTLSFNRSLDRFEFNDDVYASGSLTASGTLVTESGAYIDGNAFVVQAASNNVGIGTATPLADLHVVGAETRLDTGTTNGNVSLSFVDGGSEKAHVSLDQNTATFDIGSAGRITVNSSDYVTISGSNYTNIQGSTTFIGNNVGIGKSDPKTRLDVIGAISGSFIYATRSFSGAGLTDCDGGTSKLLWDATTGRFSCGTVTTTNWSTTGSLQTYFDNRYVNTAGDTMTGALTIQSTSTNNLLRIGDTENAGGGDFMDIKNNAINVTNANELAVATLYLNAAGGSVAVRKSTAKASFDVFGTISGSLVTQNGAGNNSFMGNVGIGSTTAKAKLAVNGVMSGVTLYATKSFSGAGLSDCDGGTSKLLWDATTGRFSCGTVTSSNWSGTGALQTAFDARYVNTAGDTMTGALRIDVIGGGANTLGLRVANTASGARLHAEQKLTSSGTLSVERQAFFTGGTLAAPGIAFADAPDTGIRHVTVGSDTQLQFINDGIATMAVSNYADQQYYPRVAIGKNISGYIGLDVYTKMSDYAASFVNDFDGLGNAHGLYVSTLQDDGDYLARFVSNSTDKFTVLTSGNVGIGAAAPKSKLAVVGTISGTSLYATKSFSGAGLSDCDAGTSKLLWDATTGRFSCGTVTSTAYTAGQGLSLNGTSFSVNSTLTGSLAEFSTVSGATVYAANSLRSSGSLVWNGVASGSELRVMGNVGIGVDGNPGRKLQVVSNTDTNIAQFMHGGTQIAVEITKDSIRSYDHGAEGARPLYLNPDGANVGVGFGSSFRTPKANLEVFGSLSGINLYAGNSMRGAGLSDCDTGGTSKLLWDATTGRFSCGTDSGATYTAGQGLTLNGTSFRLNDTVTGSVIKAATSLASSGTLVWEGAASGSTLTVSTGLTVHGDATIGTSVSDALTSFANTTFMNTVTIGSDGTDSVTVNALIGSNLNPSANNTYALGNSSNRWASGWFNSANLSSDLSVLGTSSLTGNVGIGASATTTKAKLSVNGVMSGVTVYATRSFSGAGLSDCDTAGTSKLMWDATTGRFSCGTDQSGMTQTNADLRFLKLSGGTLTGALNIQNGNTHAATLTALLNIRGTMSGRNLYVSGSGASPLLSTTTGKPTVRIGGSGMLVIEARSSDPGGAPANTVGVFAQKTAGRTMLMQASGATMAATALQTALFGNQIMHIKPGGGSTLTAEGTQALNDTTVSHPAADQVFGFMANFATAATSGDEAGASSSNTAAFRGSAAGANGFFYMTRVGVVDTTSIRVFSGMADQTIATMVGADNPSGNHVGFQFSTGRGDANWQFTTKDNSTQSVTNTGMAFSANKVYDLYFMCTKQCASITWEIQNVTDGTKATGTTSSNLPSTSTALRMVLGVESQTTAAKNIRMQQMYFESDR